MNWVSDEERVSRRREEVAYRRGYDQAMFNALQILERFGTDLGIQRLKKLKPHIRKWRARATLDKQFKRETVPGDPAYKFDVPKRVKDRKFW